MSSLVKTKVECPGCKDKTETHFKKPSLFTPTVTRFDCCGCGSQVMVKFKKLPKTPPTQVNITVLGLTPSQMLLDMLAEEKEHNAKPLEEQSS